MRIQITFKSGAQVEADVEEFASERNRYTGELTKLNWTTPAGATERLHTLVLGEVAAIVAIHPAEPDSPAADRADGAS